MYGCDVCMKIAIIYEVRHDAIKVKKRVKVYRMSPFI